MAVVLDTSHHHHHLPHQVAATINPKREGRLQKSRPFFISDRVLDVLAFLDYLALLAYLERLERLEALNPQL